LCLLVATALAAVLSARQVDQRSADALTERASTIATTIDRRVSTYVEKTFAVRAYFDVENRPSRRDFDRFMDTQAVQQRYPGALSLGFAERTLLDDRAEFIRQVDRDVEISGLPYPRFSIRPNAQRPESVVVNYIHPVVGLEAAYGFDLLSEAARRTAVERARDRARIAASAPLTFVTERMGDVRGVIVYLPLYSGRTQTPPQAERKRLFRGVGYAALRFPDLLRGLVPRGDDLELYDVGSVDAVPARIRAGDEAFNVRGEADAESRDREKSRIMPLTVAGRRWSMYYSTDRNLVSATERMIPWLILALGLVVSLLAGGVVHALATSRHRAQALAEQMTEELKRSNEELERFAFLASHDLQQPLRTVSGFVQLLERQYGEQLDAAAREYVDHALRGTKQMGTLIDDLLAYSRVSRDDRPLAPVPLDDAWDAAVDQLSATIESSDAKVRRGALPVVDGDRGQLVQVFANLIGNAVKYRGDETPEVQADARRVNGVWEIAVQDNGIGIDPRDHDRIFEMFRRLHTEDEFEGTGVGLALAKRIVERHGGHIWVEPGDDGGSRFCFTLPDAAPVIERAPERAGVTA
jgi:signal transduction histidine kinase